MAITEIIQPAMGMPLYKIIITKKQLRGQGVSYLRLGMSKTNERHKQADDGRAKGGDQLVNSVAKVHKGKEGFFPSIL